MTQSQMHHQRFQTKTIQITPRTIEIIARLGLLAQIISVQKTIDKMRANCFHINLIGNLVWFLYG